MMITKVTSTAGLPCAARIGQILRLPRQLACRTVISRLCGRDGASPMPAGLRQSAQPGLSVVQIRTGVRPAAALSLVGLTCLPRRFWQLHRHVALLRHIACIHLLSGFRRILRPDAWPSLAAKSATLSAVDHSTPSGTVGRR